MIALAPCARQGIARSFRRPSSTSPGVQLQFEGPPATVLRRAARRFIKIHSHRQHHVLDTGARATRVLHICHGHRSPWPPCRFETYPAASARRTRPCSAAIPCSKVFPTHQHCRLNAGCCASGAMPAPSPCTTTAISCAPSTPRSFRVMECHAVTYEQATRKPKVFAAYEFAYWGRDLSSANLSHHTRHMWRTPCGARTNAGVVPPAQSRLRRLCRRIILSFVEPDARLRRWGALALMAFALLGDRAGVAERRDQARRLRGNTTLSSSLSGNTHSGGTGSGIDRTNTRSICLEICRQRPLGRTNCQQGPVWTPPYCKYTPVAKLAHSLLVLRPGHHHPTAPAPWLLSRDRPAKLRSPHLHRVVGRTVIGPARCRWAQTIRRASSGALNGMAKVRVTVVLGALTDR